MSSFYRCDKCGNHASVDGARMTPTEAVYCRFCPDLTEMRLVDDPAPKHYQCISCGRRITLEGPWHGRPQGPQCPCNPNSWGNWKRTDTPGTVLYTSPPLEAFDMPRSDAQIIAFSGGRQTGKRSITLKMIHEAVEKLHQKGVPQNYKVLFPASCAEACLMEFGGRLVPCPRPTLEAYDEIIEHNEGQGLIILVEKEK